jgi:hypothetical protein
MIFPKMPDRGLLCLTEPATPDGLTAQKIIIDFSIAARF